jgi:hypothetical protein
LKSPTLLGRKCSPVDIEKNMPTWQNVPPPSGHEQTLQVRKAINKKLQTQTSFDEDVGAVVSIGDASQMS